MSDSIQDPVELYRKVIFEAATQPGNNKGLIEALFSVINRQGELVPFKLNPAQNEYYENRTQADLILKAAQLGFTTFVVADFFADAMVTPGIEVLITAQRDETAKKLFRMRDTFIANIPEEVRPPVNQDSAHTVEFDHSAVKPGLVSSITVGSAESKTFGRGRPVHRALFTEVGFYDDEALQVISGIVARMPVGLSRRVLESTANGQSGYLYETWNAAIAQQIGDITDGEATDLEPHFFPWMMSSEYRIAFDTDDRFGRALGELDEKEVWLRTTLNVDDDQLRWRRWKIAQLGSVEKFMEEYPATPEEAFLPIGTSVFDNLQVLERLLHGVKEPIETDVDGTLIWSKAVPGRPYIVSIDQASGEIRDINAKPLDFQCITVWDASDLTQVATFRKREIGARELAQKAAALSIEYNQGLVVPEANLAKFGFFEWLRHWGG